MHVLILKHIANEDAGNILDFLDESSTAYKKVNLYAGDRLPAELDNISHVVIMGGPMNVGENDKYPFLAEEDVFIKKVLGRGLPMLAICLGGQLLANACGASVYRAENEEVGIFDMQLIKSEGNEDLGILSGLPKTFPTVHWHRYTFDIPNGATQLVKSELCPNQAFVINSNAYGLQFHPEVTEEMIHDWFDDADNKDEIIQDFLSVKTEYEEAARNIYKLFFSK